MERFGPDRTLIDQAQPELGFRDYGVVAIEVWNEPNTSVFWGGPPDPVHFAKLVRRAYGGVVSKGLAGSVKMVPGGLTPDGEESPYMSERAYTSAYLRELDEVHVDRLSVHLYAHYALKDNGAERHILDRYNDIVLGAQDAGFGSTRRWITEIGFATAKPDPTTTPRAYNPAPPKANETMQRRRLIDAYLYLEDEDRKIDSFIAHRVSDGPDEPNNLGVGTIQVQGDGSLKFVDRPAYCRLARKVGAEPAVCSEP